jgi:hypothetical protein
MGVENEPHTRESLWCRSRCIERSREKFPQPACLAEQSVVVRRVGGARFSWVVTVAGPLAMTFPGRGAKTVEFGAMWNGECVGHVMPCAGAWLFFHFSLARWPSAEAFWGAVDGGCSFFVPRKRRPTESRPWQGNVWSRRTHAGLHHALSACRRDGTSTVHMYGVDRFGRCVTQTTITGEFPDTGDAHLIGHGGRIIVQQRINNPSRLWTQYGG